MEKINLHRIDWQKVMLYFIIFAFIFLYGKSCQNENNLIAENKAATKKADSLSKTAKDKITESKLLNVELADLKQQYINVEKEVYVLTNALNTIRKSTKENVQKVKQFTNKEMQNYFDSGYGDSTNSVVHLDSIPANNVITDLEIGKGVALEAENLYKENTQINLQIDNLQSQNSILETQKTLNLEAFLTEQKSNEINKNNAENNLKAFKKEKRKKILWKLATIPAFVLGVLIVK